jgi:RNA polymerase sigma-B factor
MESLEARNQIADRLWSAYTLHPSSQLREQLIEHYRPLTMAVLHRFRHRWDEDLEQVALVGLVKAVDRFDPVRGNGFPTFAVPTILGELKRFLRDQSRLVRCPRSLLDLHAAVGAKEGELTQQFGRSPTLTEIAAALGKPLDRVVEAMAIEETCHPCSLDDLPPSREYYPPVALEECVGAEDPELKKVEERIAWEQELDQLDPRLRRVMRLRYYDNLSQREAAQCLGVSQMQVSRLERRALDRLRCQVAVR